MIYNLFKCRQKATIICIFKSNKVYFYCFNNEIRNKIMACSHAKITTGKENENVEQKCVLRVAIS